MALRHLFESILAEEGLQQAETETFLAKNGWKIGQNCRKNALAGPGWLSKNETRARPGPRGLRPGCAGSLETLTFHLFSHQFFFPERIVCLAKILQKFAPLLSWIYLANLLEQQLGGSVVSPGPTQNGNQRSNALSIYEGCKNIHCSYDAYRAPASG